ncbi:hypothetical protein BAUCODRAFT_126778 [Baudoinia panamericana UAMH 10762]|uniref:Uncharacterized protein n=1 Tax=Baudoinia panamericana (strain UAMH 10762) TaxID=717646 RepID=M2LCU0_BAUPA|nr:uncharacterized protein BAUCODRAFT_126778 [Baudoinia panamericana UAMH 10762]EMC91792.1 hypothetical protein BAUCODRAFT_126778 [Baudoinia panamericana UAMH 10762]
MPLFHGCLRGLRRRMAACVTAGTEPQAAPGWYLHGASNAPGGAVLVAGSIPAGICIGVMSLPCERSLERTTMKSVGRYFDLQPIRADLTCPDMSQTTVPTPAGRK